MATPARQRALPSVERILKALEPFDVPRPMAVRLVRDRLASARGATDTPIPAFEVFIHDLRRELQELAETRLQPVINGTGILAHTNLGRAPLGDDLVESVRSVALGYSNLEISLIHGRRGHRGAYVEHGLALLCQAEAATVVNNGAAALVLILHHLTAGSGRHEVVISRGELIQIGGGFRIPDILQTSGAQLREIGTTNQTSIQDYRRAIGTQTALVLRVHPSNFYMEGFVDRPADAEVAAAAKVGGVPFVVDLGSGALMDLTAVAGLHSEPMPGQTLAAGADLVCFSGDKLLGGPQAGIIAGSRSWIDRLKADPLFRALRCDKLVFAALQATIDAYLHAAARRDAGPPKTVPMVNLMLTPVADLRARAVTLQERLRPSGLVMEVRASDSQIGGGVCPRSSMPSIALRIPPPRGNAEGFLDLLRKHRPPVIGRVSDGCCWIDLRTVFPSQDETLVCALQAVAQELSAGGPTAMSGDAP
ncbi:MAG: L-seryl-tRNA(Sec) selenium transferase [Verrucomicrobiales bacterium]|nr:L-seryl-tRNA(Sec) selenium transferase [Verrucomicrobiales bacterium]